MCCAAKIVAEHIFLTNREFEHPKSKGNAKGNAKCIFNCHEHWVVAFIQNGFNNTYLHQKQNENINHENKPIAYIQHPFEVVISFINVKQKQGDKQ